MGVERSFQALPAEQRLIELAGTNADLGEIFSIAFTYFRAAGGPPRGPSSPASKTLNRAVCELLTCDPGLATRNCYIDRRWDQIHYLLSASRRGSRSEPDDAVFDIALGGEATIAFHVIGAQGFPVRHTSPAMVAQIDSLLARLEVQSLRRYYDLAAMEAQGVYKAFAGRESPEDWQFLKGLIRELQAFYADAARARNSVLVLTD